MDHRNANKFLVCKVSGSISLLKLQKFCRILWLLLWNSVC